MKRNRQCQFLRPACRKFSQQGEIHGEHLCCGVSGPVILPLPDQAPLIIQAGPLGAKAQSELKPSLNLESESVVGGGLQG